MNKENIERYYNECNRDYEIVWQLKSSLALHYGYWDEHTLTHRQALWNSNYQIAKHAQIKSSDYVLDAGCGVGGTSFFLAQNIGCKVQGITLSQTQLSQANELKNNLDQSGLTSFSIQDYCNTNFADNTFDVVFAVESAMYSEPKNMFLEEAFRILKPGGRLLVADYYIEKPINDPYEKSILAKWAKSWLIESFIIESAYHSDLNNIGYVDLLPNDATDKIWPSIKLMNRSYYPGILISRVSNLFGYRTSFQVENSKSGKYQYQAFKKGLLKYKYLLAFKPPAPQAANSINDYISKDLKIEPYVDTESLKGRFPIISKSGFSPRNIIKRCTHFYLETGIRKNDRWF